MNLSLLIDPALSLDQETKVQREQLICLESHSKYAQVTQPSEFFFFPVQIEDLASGPWNIG